MAVVVRAARADEHASLEALLRRASLSNSAYCDQLLAHPEVLTLPANDLPATLVAERKGAIAGFAVVQASGGDAELDGLFVEPALKRQGIGRQLVASACDSARDMGAGQIDVVAGPEAIAFYESCGFKRIADAPTQFGPAARLRLHL